MIKIFYVIDSFETGGAQRQLLELLRGLDRTRYEAVVCPVWPLMDLEEEYRATGVKIIQTHKCCHWDISYIWRLAREIRTFQPQIVHTWLFTGNLWGNLAASLARVPVVALSLRNVVTNGGLSRGQACVFSIAHSLARSADVILANSQAGRENPGLPIWAGSSKLRVIYNGVDLHRFNPDHASAWRRKLRQELGLRPDTMILGTIGRLAPQKGHDGFLQTVRRLVEAGYDITTLLIGEGPREAELKVLAAELGLQDRVRFLGRRQDTPQLLSLFNIFVLPSRWEGFPNVILEAMAMGLPVVATDVGGVRELVLQEQTGLLVEADDPLLLAGAVRRLLDNPELAQRLGQEGHRRAQEFSLERMVAETTALYDDLLRQKEIRP